MNKALGLGIGLLIGLVVGAAVVMWYSPATGDKLINNVKRGYRDTIEEANRVSQQRRRELEAQLRQR